MAWRPSQIPLRFSAQAGIQIFERSEKSCKRIVQMPTAPAALLEIAAPKLIHARK
jgi:hypothetical protein